MATINRAFIQQIIDSGIIASGTAVNPTANTTQGNTLILIVRHLSSGNLTSITDSQGNVWTIDVKTTAGTTNIAIAHAYLVTALGTGDTITVNGTVSGNFQVYEFSGIQANVPANKTGSATSAAVTTLAPSNTGAQTDPNILAITGVATAGANTFTVPATYTGVLPPTTTGMDMGYVFANSTAGRAPSWSWTTSQACAVAIATFAYVPPQALNNYMGMDAGGGISVTEKIR